MPCVLLSGSLFKGRSGYTVLSSQPYILEDGPELPKVPGSHAEEGGEALEGMYTDGCTSIEESWIVVNSGRVEG
jgi:hypothetical protein